MVGLYYGSFDPYTKGHEDIARQASELFETVYICILSNPTKKRWIPVSSIKQYLISVFANSNVKVYTGNQKTSWNIAKAINANYFIRGLRNNGVDYPYEETMAKINKDISGLDTIFLRPDPEHDFISSSALKYMIINGDYENALKYVPENSDYLLKEYAL